MFDDDEDDDDIDRLNNSNFSLQRSSHSSQDRVSISSNVRDEMSDDNSFDDLIKQIRSENRKPDNNEVMNEDNSSEPISNLASVVVVSPVFCKEINFHGHSYCSSKSNCQNNHCWI